jgi:hypothetical protein
MLHYVAWKKFTDVSEVLAACIIIALIAHIFTVCFSDCEYSTIGLQMVSSFRLFN